MDPTLVPQRLSPDFSDFLGLPPVSDIKTMAEAINAYVESHELCDGPIVNVPAIKRQERMILLDENLLYLFEPYFSDSDIIKKDETWVSYPRFKSLCLKHTVTIK